MVDFSSYKVHCKIKLKGHRQEKKGGKMLDNDFEEMQNLYMKMHERDYGSHLEEWEQTLYAPLRKYVLSLITKCFSHKKIDFVYIGCGPRSPLFQDINLSHFFESKFRSITLIDISEEALESSYKKLKSIFKNVSISKIKIDITTGYSKYFAELVTQQIKSLNKNSPESHFSFKEEKLNVAQNFIAKDFPLLQADLVYSEMVATFTGTAIMLELEKRINHLRTSEDFKDETLKNHISEAYESWKRFNYYSFYIQANNALTFTREKGILSTTCDTIKMFDNPKLKNISSFPNNQKVSLENLPLKKIKNLHYPHIWWRDYPTNEHQDKVTALEAHRHKIEFFTFQKGG